MDFSLRRWLIVDRNDGLLDSAILPPGFRPLNIRGAVICGGYLQLARTTADR